MLLLSGQRNFAVRLNKVYKAELRIAVPPFEGTHGDLLLLVVHELLVGSNAKLASLYNCLLTVLVNVSPYLKRLSLVAANKLVHLFEVFTSRRFLLAAERNHHLVFFLVEALNNLIQYQFDGNHHLVYVIIRRRQVFERLTQLRVSPFADPAGSGGSAAAAPSTPPTSTGAPRPKIRSALGPAGPTEHFSVAGGSAGEGAFVPTDDWLDGWRSQLPFEAISRLLAVLVPQVEKLCSTQGVTDETEVLEYLKNGTMVGLLPVPHPIVIRKYQTSPAASIWFSAYLWGVIYLKHLEIEVWHGTTVRLFRVQVAEE